LAEQAARQDATEQALAALNESDAAIAATHERLGRLGQEARAAETEWRRRLRERDELESGRAQAVTELSEIEARLRNAEQDQPTAAAEPVDREQIAAAAEAARSVEVEARLAVRTPEERANAVRGTAD
jgi:chromosome segregation protein